MTRTCELSRSPGDGSTSGKCLTAASPACAPVSTIRSKLLVDRTYLMPIGVIAEPAKRCEHAAAFGWVEPTPRRVRHARRLAARLP